MRPCRVPDVRLNLFVESVHQWTVANPEDGASRLLFLMTANNTGRLAADRRESAHEAPERERGADVLSEDVRLVSERDLEDPHGAVAERLHQEVVLAASAVEGRVQVGWDSPSRDPWRSDASSAPGS